jgi:hypothetical protein
MGEYAEMMLDGTCCSSCGDFLDIDGMASGSFEPNGFATLCANCRRAERREPRIPRAKPYGKHNPKVAQPGDAIRKGDTMACPFCVRRVKVTGFGDHMLDQHKDKWPAADLLAERAKGGTA